MTKAKIISLLAYVADDAEVGFAFTSGWGGHYDATLVGAEMKLTADASPTLTMVLEEVKDDVEEAAA